MLISPPPPKVTKGIGYFVVAPAGTGYPVIFKEWNLQFSSSPDGTHFTDWYDLATIPGAQPNYTHSSVKLGFFYRYRYRIRTVTLEYPWSGDGYAGIATGSNAVTVGTDGVTPDIADDAITSDKIAPGSVFPVHITGTIDPFTFPGKVQSVIGGFQFPDSTIQTTAAATLGTVTSLPGSPTDGQLINFVADAANGIIWQLRYRTAASSSYKWEFIGGPPLTSYIPTTEVGTTAGTQDLTTTGPSITLPLAGDYDVMFKANAFQAGSLAGFAQLELTDGSNVALGNDYYTQGSVPGVSSPERIQSSGFTRAAGLAASSVIKIRYNSSTNNMSYRERRLNVVPVRVG